MGFTAYKVEENTTNRIDFKAREDYIITNAGLENKETLIGIVSGIIDLGFQKQDDAEFEFHGTPEEEQAIIEQFNGNTYFITKPEDGKRYKCWKRGSSQGVAFTVDFPDIMLDQSQFFEGEESTGAKPLRLILNQERMWKGGVRDVSKVFNLKPMKGKTTNNIWSLSFNSTIYKMAIGAKLIATGEPFLPESVGNLVGKALQFEVQICRNERGFYQESIKYASGLGRGMVAPDFPQDMLYGIGFDSPDNDLNKVKEMRQSLINRIMLAGNYEGSELQKQINSIGRGENKWQTKYEGVTGEQQKDDGVEDSTPPPAAVSNFQYKASASSKPEQSQQLSPMKQEPVDMDEIPF